MGLPAFGMEGMYRNDGTEVSRFLREKHRDAAWICNLSERLYDKELFDNRVSELGFPDHHSPPLEIALGNLYAMESWLRAGEANVVVVHCLAGKGRTGAILGSFLAMRGTFAFEPVRPEPGKSLSDSWREATGEFHDVFRELLPPHVEGEEPDTDGSSDATGLRTPAGAPRAKWVLSPQRPGGYGRAGLQSLVTPSAMKQSKRLTLAAQMAAEGFVDDGGEVSEGESEGTKGEGVEMGPVAASGSSGAAHSAEPMARWRLAHPHRAACMSLRAFHVRRGEGVTYAAQTRTVTQVAFAARECMRRAAVQELPPGQVHLCGHPAEEEPDADEGAGASHCGSPRLARGGDVPCLEIDATPAQLEAVRARAARLFRSMPLAAPSRKVRLLAVEIALCPRVTSGRLHPYLTIRSTPHQREGRQGRVFYNSAWDCAGRRLGSYSPPPRAVFDADSGDAWRGRLAGRRAGAGVGSRPRGSSSSSMSSAARAADASGGMPDVLQEARARSATMETAAAEALRRCDDHASPMREASFVFRLGGPRGGGAGVRDAGAWDQGAGCVVDGDVTVRLVHQPGPEGALEPGGIVAAEPQELCRWTLHTNLMHTERSFRHASPVDGSVKRRTVYRLGDIDMESRKRSINAFHPAFRADVWWQYEDEQEQRLEEEARGERESEAEAAGGALAAAIGGGKSPAAAPAVGGEAASGGEHGASAPVAEEASDPAAASSIDRAASATFVDIGDDEEEEEVAEGHAGAAGAASDGDKGIAEADGDGADSSGKTDGKEAGASSRPTIERPPSGPAALATEQGGVEGEGTPPAKARSDALRVAAAGRARSQEQDVARKEEAKRVAARSAAAAAVAGAATGNPAGGDGTPPAKESGSCVASSQAARPRTQSQGPPSRQPLPRARAPLVARGELAAAHGVLETLTEGSIAELLQGTGPMPRGGGPAGGLAQGAGGEGAGAGDRSEMGSDTGRGQGQGEGGASKGRRGLLPSAGEWVPRHWVLRRCVLYSYRSPLDAVPWEGLPLSDVVGLGRARASVVGEGRAGIQLTLRSAAGSGPLGTAGFFGGERQLVLRCPAVRRGESGDAEADFERWLVALVTAHAAVTALRHRPGGKQGRGGR